MSLNVRYVLKQRTTLVAKPILRAAFRVLYPVRKRIGALRMRRWAQRLRFESWALHRCTWPNWNNDWHVARAHRSAAPYARCVLRIIWFGYRILRTCCSVVALVCALSMAMACAVRATWRLGRE